MSGGGGVVCRHTTSSVVPLGKTMCKAVWSLLGCTILASKSCILVHIEGCIIFFEAKMGQK